MRALTVDEILALPDEPRRWGGWQLSKRTYELTYKPYGDREYVYPIDLEQLTTSAEVLNMIMQVNTKLWATDGCVAGLVRALNDILHPQAHLCSSGRSSSMTVPEIKHFVRRTRSS